MAKSYVRSVLQPRSPVTNARQIARLGKRVRAFRSEIRPEAGGKAMSQRELARLTGLSPATVGELERGKHEPRLGTMLVLRDALGLGSIEELLGPMPSAPPTTTRPKLEGKADPA